MVIGTLIHVECYFYDSETIKDFKILINGIYPNQENFTSTVEAILNTDNKMVKRIISAEIMSKITQIKEDKE